MTLRILKMLSSIAIGVLVVIGSGNAGLAVFGVILTYILFELMHIRILLEKEKNRGEEK